MTRPNYTLRAVDWKALITEIGNLAESAARIKKIWDTAKDNCVDADIESNYTLEDDFDDVVSWITSWHDGARKYLPSDLVRTALHRIDTCDDPDDRRSAVADYGEMEELREWAARLSEKST